MHELDYGLGDGIRPLSSCDMWRTLYEQTQSSPHADYRFPTWNSRQNPEEFFSECATIFLRLHVGPHGEVKCRWDLERWNPEVIPLLEDLFENHIPRRLNTDRFHTVASISKRLL